MEIINVFYYLAVILFLGKLFGLLARKAGLPQVAGMVIAGVVIGLLGRFHSSDNFFLSFFVAPGKEEMDVLHVFSQIGVVLILFSSGMETNLAELKRSGFSASMIALAGVLAPMALGIVGALAYMHGFSDYSADKLINAVFIGTILSATSVGITAETLKELGKIDTKVGQTIISAAIIDDVLGIIALSMLSSVREGGAALIGITLLKTLGFFVFSIALGVVMRRYFKWEERKFPHKRRTSIFALATCFFFAFCAEKFFGIAAITGAYMAGIMHSGLEDTNFVDRKIVVSGYMMFSPIFFTYIGISADFSAFNARYLIFIAIFVLLGIAGKILGCGAMAKAFGFNLKESATVGCGMIARGEVALAVYAAGSSLIAKPNGLDPLVATIFLIVISSVVCPILLKTLFKNSKKEEKPVGKVDF